MLRNLIIENAKPRQAAYKLSDGGGLVLLVQPNGSKLWRLRYHFNRKEKMLSLGVFPDVSLSAARDKCKAAHALLDKDIDPSQQRKNDEIAKAISANNTFGAVADELLDSLTESKRSPLTVGKIRWILKDLCAPLCRRPIADITPAEILVVLKKVEKSGRRETARRLRSNVSRVFKLAVATLRAPSDPTYSLQGAIAPPVVTHRAAITDEIELGALMVCIDEYDGWPTIRSALLFTALTMVRPGEVRFMRRVEVLWPSAIWKIPAERMKMKRPHEVPLSRQAVAVLRDIWPLSEGHELVFPSIRSLRKPLSENAMNSALRRIGYSSEEVCAHGLRTSASTILNERFPELGDVIEAALAHEEENSTRRAYKRTTYLPQRTKLMQDWADLLDDFKKRSSARTVA